MKRLIAALLIVFNLGCAGLLTVGTQSTHQYAVHQRLRWDCGIAALATLLFVTYDKADAAFEGGSGQRLSIAQSGLWTDDILQAARNLGRPLRWSQENNPDDFWDGLYLLRFADNGFGQPWNHFVVIRDGVVYDPSLFRPISWNLYAAANTFEIRARFYDPSSLYGDYDQ